MTLWQRLPFRLRVWLLLLRIRLLYRWRRSLLSWHLPLEPEPRSVGGELPAIDTGGAYRPPFRSQFGDSSESHTSPHSEGSNCTMSAAAMALAYETGGRLDYLGGHMRHAQGDQDGGTDLYDAAEAWASKGHALSIRSGRGWAQVAADLAAGRGIILQGTGGLAGCGNYGGGHAVYVNPERSGTRWLKGDPECGGWEWCEERTLELWAEELSSTVMYAATAAQAGGGSEVVALAVIDRREQLGDVAAGVEFFEAPGGARLGSMSKAFSGLHVVGVPMDKSEDALNLGWRAVWVTTQAVNGVSSDKLVYIQTANIANLRTIPPAPTPEPPPSGDEYQRGRADEWQTWATGLGIPPEPEG